MKTPLKHSYSNSITNQKIAILGPSPDTRGGIAIHIARVTRKLKNENNQVRFFDTTQEGKRNFIRYFASLKWFLLSYRPTIVYYHTLFLRSHWLEFGVIVLMKKIVRYRLVLVEHNCRYLNTKSSTYKWFLTLFMRGVNQQVLIGNVVAHAYQAHHMHHAPQVSVESPFLPPDFEQEQIIFNAYPAELHSFLKSHSLIIIANASHVMLYNGIDLYGFDMCIELIAQLKKDYQRIGMIFAFPRIGDEQYFAHLKKLIDEKGINEHWLFFIQQQELWPLMKHADLLVRPNYHDTYGISVEEALVVGTPALASDVCMRPAGTILFESRNQKDFEDKVKIILGKT